MKWIFEFWRSFCQLAIPEGDFWLTTPCQSAGDKYPGGSTYFGVSQTMLVRITEAGLRNFTKTIAGNFTGHLLQISDSESSLVRATVIPLSKVRVLGKIPGGIELTLHPNSVSLRVQFSDPNVSRGYCAFSLHADCLQILLKKKEVRDSEGVWLDLSLSAAVTFQDYYLADYPSFVLLSREQVKKLLLLSNADLCRNLFTLFGQERLSDTPGKYGTSFGCVTSDLTNKMEKFANS
jgi:hypothetical protein